MYGSQEKIFNVKFFTVYPYSVGIGVSQTFSKLGKIQIFFNIKTSTIKSEEKNISKNTFFCKKNLNFWKNYNFVLSPLHTATCNIIWVNWHFSTHLWYARVCGKIQIHPNIALGGVQGRQNQNIPWIKWNHTVSHYANGPGWPLWQANYLLSIAFKGW